MLKGEDLIYVRHEHRSGISNKTNEPYEFANIILSDGLESFQLPVDFSVLPTLQSFRRGQSVDLEIDLDIGFNNRINLLVIAATPVKEKAKS